MKMIDVMKKRYSVRDFKDIKVEDKIINKIVDAGLLAPTAHNNEPCRIRVIKSDSGIEKLNKCTVCHYNAKLAFLVSYMDDECWERSYDNKKSGDTDSSIITTYMMLEAESLGLDTCWIMYFIPEACKKEFELDENEVPSQILLVGYKTNSSKPAPAHTKKKDKNIIIKEV